MSSKPPNMQHNNLCAPKKVCSLSISALPQGASAVPRWQTPRMTTKNRRANFGARPPAQEVHTKLWS